jgi:hypothetical protein
MLHQSYREKITALLVPVLVVSMVLPSQAKPRKSAQTSRQFQIQAIHATQIPAGSLGNFVVLLNSYTAGPMTGISIQESKQVSLPVPGRGCRTSPGQPVSRSF